MPSPMLSYQQGTFTSTGAAGYVVLPFSPGYIETFNYTQAASVANPGVVKKSWWQSGMPNASYVGIRNTDALATDQFVTAASGGYTPFDLSSPPSIAASTITSINQNSAATVTTSGVHGLAVGDLVRLVGVTGQLQLSTYEFQVQTVGSTTTFTIPCDTSGFAATASGGTVRKIFRSLYAPAERFITKITAASPAVITTAINHGFVAGDVISLRVPVAFGMTQANLLDVKVVSVTGTTITTDLDASSFTAFAFPVSASYVTSKAEVVPAGASSSNVVNATTNSGFKGILLGTAVVGLNADVMYWKAWYPDAFQTTLGS